MSSAIDIEDRAGRDHPLRPIRKVVGGELARTGRLSGAAYADTGGLPVNLRRRTVGGGLAWQGDVRWQPGLACRGVDRGERAENWMDWLRDSAVAMGHAAAFGFSVRACQRSGRRSASLSAGDCGVRVGTVNVRRAHLAEVFGACRF